MRALTLGMARLNLRRVTVVGAGTASWRGGQPIYPR